MKRPALITGIVILAVAIIGVFVLIIRSPQTTSPATALAVSPITTTTPPTASSTTAYALTDVANHNTKTDCWFAVDGSVYNLTNYIETGFHKAGMDIVIKSCGTNAIQTFAQGHGKGRKAQRAYEALVPFVVGTLK